MSLVRKPASVLLASAWAAIVLATGCHADPDATARQHVVKGDSYVSHGLIKQAIIEYRNALKTVPRHAEAQYKLARAYSAPGVPTKAYEAYAKTAEHEPSNVHA